ncbi:MAG: hypothetical protein E3J60_01160 [Dehalococcoidia bacterium]|nr:MAG: hypothetical protein E3J60_01160 [Dehalococcoidia bacterium]
MKNQLTKPQILTDEQIQIERYKVEKDLYKHTDYEVTEWDRVIARATFRETLKMVVKDYQTLLDFARNVAKHFDECRDSRIFFIMQQAFGDTEWEEVQDIITTVIAQSENLNQLAGEK